LFQFRRLLESRHRRIGIYDILEVADEREGRGAGGESLRTALDDGGLLDGDRSQVAHVEREFI
jgi:hypothetical protein